MISWLIENNVNKLLAREAKKHGLHNRSTVLNVACEFERVPPSLTTIVESDDVFCVEINRELVKADPKIKYCNVDVNRFPFPDEKFDYAISVFGIEHFRTERVFRETKRTLKKGGAFIFVVPNVLYPAFFINWLLGERFARFFYRRIVKSTYRPHKTYYHFNRLGAIQRVARRAGYSRTDVLFFGPSGILSYFNQYPLLQKMATWFERLLTNRVLFRFKPYIIGVLTK